MLGATVPAVGGYHMAFQQGDKWQCQCIQIYITPSRRWKVPDLSQTEIVKFKQAWKKSNIKKVVAHVPYLVNLASNNQILWKKSIKRLEIELSRANKLGVSFLILHPGSYGTSTKPKGIKRIILALNQVLRNYTGKTMILLETMAGQGTMIGSKFEEIALILKTIKRSKSIGVCLDTGHIFMSGYDIRDSQGYKKILTKFDQIIGLKKIKAIHLNDSKADCGSIIDRHASIGKGKIGLKTFQLLIKDKRFKNIPKLLELKEEETIESLKLLQKK